MGVRGSNGGKVKWVRLHLSLDGRPVYRVQQGCLGARLEGGVSGVRVGLSGVRVGVRGINDGGIVKWLHLHVHLNGRPVYRV